MYEQDTEVLGTILLGTLKKLEFSSVSERDVRASSLNAKCWEMFPSLLLTFLPPCAFPPRKVDSSGAQSPFLFKLYECVALTEAQ